MGRPIKRLHAEPGAVKELERRSRSATVDVRDRERADIILLRLDGVGVEAVATQLKTTSKRVSTWSRRFEVSGLNGLADRPGRGRKASILSQLTGKLITRTEATLTHVEGLRFLKQIDRETPRDVDLHLIADNDATHKHPTVRAWLAKQPRLHMHLTPTSSSWLNLAERFFADLTGDVVRAGSFTSVNELVRDIKAYLAVRNADAKPSLWRAAGAEILAKIKRARVALTAAAAA